MHISAFAQFEGHANGLYRQKRLEEQTEEGGGEETILVFLIFLVLTCFISQDRK